MSKIYRQAVMAVIINEEAKVLIGYSPRDKSYKFPQGGLEDNEDLLTGIARELKEELNYLLHEDHVLEVYQEKVRYPFPPDCHPLYMGQELSIVKIKHRLEAETIPQDDEFDRLLWIKPQEISSYNYEYRSEAYKRALEICGLIH
ncbi:NUDIX domain-containing protein [Lutimonas saemankumensis]|uniref:NUDIX domain-containing protein n=1 Tax=Lutimonas saemankumensis TaxID=483016 RepID=UPI001CD80DA0|nr:NUDIX domain-containing protein [Lutimonas saemankumensis]MCA0933846.1 NUDIX domain-containing protein [Lutimonas saemankumensis]